MPYKIVDITPRELIWIHGADATKVVMIMMDRAIEEHHSDEALELDRLRREVARTLLASSTGDRRKN